MATPTSTCKMSTPSSSSNHKNTKANKNKKKKKQEIAREDADVPTPAPAPAPTSDKKRKFGQEIDEIFKDIGKKKENNNNNNKEESKSSREKGVEKKKKKKGDVGGGGAFSVGHVVGEEKKKKNNRRKTNDGMTIYSAEELAINNPDAGAYSDADWASCPDDRRSITGFVIFFGKNPFSWSSRKQSTVARSSTESEFRALANAATELTWLQSLCGELGIFLSLASKLYCDNLGALYLIANPMFHFKMKHMEIDLHFVRDKVSKKDLHVHFITTKE